MPLGRASWVLGLMIATALSAASPAQPQGAPKPDLVMTEAKPVSGHPYVFEGGTARFWVGIKNAGSAPAPPSKVTVLLTRGGKEHPFGVLHVPRLAPREKFVGKTRGVSADFPLGRYFVFLAADLDNKIAEPTKDNNDKGFNFYVVRRAWDGVVSGDYEFGGGNSAETWTAIGKFGFAGKRAHSGIFVYAYRSDVLYGYSGTDEFDCTYSGQHTVPIGYFTISLDYDKEHYFGTGFVGQHLYAVDVGGEFCTDEEKLGRTEGPYWPTVFDLPADADQDLPFGTEKLTGQRNDPGGPVLYQWSLHD